jgi:hypothetical protein
MYARIRATLGLIPEIHLEGNTRNLLTSEATLSIVGHLQRLPYPLSEDLLLCITLLLRAALVNCERIHYTDGHIAPAVLTAFAVLEAGIAAERMVTYTLALGAAATLLTATALLADIRHLTHCRLFNE